MPRSTPQFIATWCGIMVYSVFPKMAFLEMFLFVAFLSKAKSYPAMDAQITATAYPNNLLVRKDSSEFIGWDPLKKTSMYCAAGQEYTTSNRWAGCIDGSQTRVAMGCASKSLLLYPDSTWTCWENTKNLSISRGTNAFCATNLVRSDLNDGLPLELLGCYPFPTGVSVYREITTGPSVVSVSLTSTSPEETETETNASNRPTETQPSKENKNEHLNQAWIAGPVVGGLGGMAIIGILVYIVRLLRKRSSPTSSRDHSATTPILTPPHSPPTAGAKAHSLLVSPFRQPKTEAAELPAPRPQLQPLSELQ